jgi:molybdenum cofactor cytidylyltransferase
VTADPLVIVLASGRGERFFASGGSTPKLQAMLGGRTVLERTLAAVRGSGLPFHLENIGHSGMGDSIAAGVRATADATSWLILPGDLPLVQPSSLRLIAAAPADLDVVVPVVRGQRGHPVRFSARCGPDLMALMGAQGAAAVVRARGVAELQLDDIGCITDIDTVEDLRQAESLLAIFRC